MTEKMYAAIMQQDAITDALLLYSIIYSDNFPTTGCFGSIAIMATRTLSSERDRKMTIILVRL